MVSGGVLGLGTAIAIVADLAQSPQSEHRAPLASVCVGWAIVGGFLFLVPRRRVAMSRWREPFFLLWSATVIGSIAVGIVIETRPGTPLMAAFFLPLVFAAISNPVIGTVIVGSMVLVGSGISSARIGNTAADSAFVVMVIVFMAVMVVWQSYGRARRAAQIASEHGRAQLYLDVAGTIIVLLNHDGTIGQVNRKTCEFLGYREDELLGRDWFDLAVPDYFRETARDVFVNAIAGINVASARPETPVVTRATSAA